MNKHKKYTVENEDGSIDVSVAPDGGASLYFQKSGTKFNILLTNEERHDLLSALIIEDDNLIEEFPCPDHTPYYGRCTTCGEY